MLFLKKIITLLAFSVVLCGCSSPSIITKTMYTDGIFKYRATETEINDGFAVIKGNFSTDVDGNYKFNLEIEDDSESNSITITGEGKYNISASDDKNGLVNLLDNLVLKQGKKEKSINEDELTVTYTNYYFMFFNFVIIGKICFVR